MQTPEDYASLARRILIIGSGGAGKSTFARRLSQATALPLIHLDKIFWKPGWVESSKEAFDAKIDQIASQPEWIMDGNFNRTLEMRLRLADLVFYLDIPRWICLRNVLKRVLFARPEGRPDMAAGCPEKVDWAFLQWIWNFRKTHHERYLRLLEESGKPYLVLRNYRDIERIFEKQAEVLTSGADQPKDEA
ncbi:MAG: hypothetical protein VB108_01460 [Anaerolineaceae bacterium]|nr:hypothetical protein [Anaerolineaceae bacterium]